MANPIKEKPGPSPSTPTEEIDHLIVGPGPTKHSHRGLILLGLALLIIGISASILIRNAAPKSSTPSDIAPTIKTTTTQLPAVQTRDAQVSIASAGFIPANLRLKAGSQVTWTNTSSAAQSLTSPQLEDLASDTLQPKDSYSFTFELAGTYTITNGTNSTTITVVK